MSNSPLVQYTHRSPNHSGKRTQQIRGVVLHHVAGVLSVETLGRIFAPTSRQASSNYGIGYDGRIALYVDEANRSWCTSSNRVDQQMVTIEASNSAIGGTWPVSDLVFNRAVELTVDIFKRNGIKKAVYTGNENGNLWLHKWYAQTACPGPYVEKWMNWFADEVNKKLSPSQPAAKGLKYEEIKPKIEKRPRQITVYDEVVLKPHIRLLQDDHLWEIDFDDWSKAKSVKKFPKGSEFELADIVTNKLGGRYGRTPYSKSKNILNGINMKVCELFYK